MQQSPLINPLMYISYGLLVYGEAHDIWEEAKLLQGCAQRTASRELWLFISRCFDNMCDQCSVWKCYATLYTPQHPYEAWGFCGGMGQAQPEEHWPCLWDFLLYTVDIINTQYALREHRRKEANYHVFKQDIRYKLALCIWFAPCWQWRLHFLFLCRRYLHVTGQDNDSFQIIWLIITCCSLLSRALVGLLFFKFYFKVRFTCPKNKVK